MTLLEQRISIAADQAAKLERQKTLDPAITSAISPEPGGSRSDIRGDRRRWS